MERIVTIVAGHNPDIDGVEAVIARMADSGLLLPFTDEEWMRPAIAVDGVEVLCEPENYRQVCAVIADAGFQVVGGPDS
jgi:hypothetical protein